ncbi:MAG: ClbS/DfsB family four-helix bundle protein [Ktedonobacteraceae bacterium]|nr:ClbS/DfsB family four-helix bundle protein [Ktedonobacteraceae bacterium]
MTQAPFKPILLDLLQQAHLAQNDFLQELDAAERTAIGTPEHWSAKDHVAHMTFWRQHVVRKLIAVLHHETPPASEDFEQINAQVFEEQRQRSWSEVLSDTEQVFTALTAHIQQFTEEDLVAFNRFDWIPEGEPLYTVIVGNSYGHAQEHFAQYYLDRHDLPRATHIYETWTNKVVQAEVPEPLKGIALYNLACFYATHAQLEKASAPLQQALTLYPYLKEWSLADPDLVALRD